MQLRQILSVSFCTLMLSLDACAVPAAGPSAIRGVVVDPNGVPVAQANVSIGGSSTSVLSDADGKFVLPYSGKAGDKIALAAQGNTYARVVRPYKVQGSADVILTVQALDTLAAIALPGVGESPVTISVPNSDGGATLSIPAAAMVTPSGTVASGAASVRLTYWHPSSNLSSAPGVLVTQAADGSQLPLQTFGMTDIEVLQNGQILQVAPGHVLTLTVGAAAVARPLLAAGQGMPNLYSLDPNNGFWHLEGSTTDGMLAYNSQTAQFTAQLHHLSSWNIDTGIPASNGGCVQGKVVNACDPNEVLANHPVTVWLLDWEQVADFRGTSDNSGNYCIAAPAPSYLGDSAVSSHYLVSGASVSQTLQCNPAPTSCFDCYNGSDLSSSFCSDCRFGTTFVGAARGSVIYYNDTCATPTPVVTFNPCHFCPGDPRRPATCTTPGSNGQAISGGCSELQKLQIPGPDCHCTAGKCDMCVDQNGVCDSQHPCCHAGDGSAVECLDQICVPGEPVNTSY